MNKTTATARAIDFLNNDMLTSLPIRLEVDSKPYDLRVREAVDLLNATNKQVNKIVVISLLYTYIITANEISKQANY